MDMNLHIIVKEKMVKLVLVHNAQEIGSLEFPEKHNLTETLLPCIDSLLRKYKLVPGDVEKVTSETDLGESYTTRRIVEAVANAFNWAKFF